MFFFQVVLLIFLFLIVAVVGIGTVSVLFFIITSISLPAMLSGLFAFLAIALLVAGDYVVFMIAYKIVKMAAEKMDKEN